MAESKGCLKKTLFGCLGLTVLNILIAIGGGLWAVNMVNRNQDTGPVLPPLADLDTQETRDAFPASALGYPGRVIINVRRGEFHIQPAAAGEPAHVEGRYDPQIFQLTENFIMLPDSTWVYQVLFEQIGSGLKTMFKGGNKARVDIHLPRDTPFDLDALARQGGIEAELGGLWITNADIRYSQGGFVLSLREPLREPMNTLAIRGSMGGFQGSRLGNASPRAMLVRCGMGGANLDLHGEWQGDCTLDLGVIMGGLAVHVPRDVEIAGDGGSADGELRDANPEIPVPPVLSFKTSAKMGKVDILRK